MTFFDILSLLAGLVFFLFGMNTMSDGLEKAAGSKLEIILTKTFSFLFFHLFYKTKRFKTKLCLKSFILYVIFNFLRSSFRIPNFEFRIKL